MTEKLSYTLTAESLHIQNNWHKSLRITKVIVTYGPDKSPDRRAIQDQMITNLEQDLLPGESVRIPLPEVFDIHAPWGLGALKRFWRQEYTVCLRQLV